jgi:hypothetical protein
VASFKAAIINAVAEIRACNLLNTNTFVLLVPSTRVLLCPDDGRNMFLRNVVPTFHTTRCYEYNPEDHNMILPLLMLSPQLNSLFIMSAST